MLSPATALMAVAFILPMIWLVRLSLDRAQDGGVLIQDVSLATYAQFFGDPFYRGILWRTLGLGITVTLVTLVCSY
ncbi:MAG: hypothetical protein ACRETD_07680, partial [Steroidobacteraceae bacterium]